jgi:hypothetical protein
MEQFIFHICMHSDSAFFVGKKDVNLRPTQDYRYLNEQTIKDAFPLPLIQELVDRLRIQNITQSWI